jgi:isopenicillin-N N-acyltransferase-like protein
MLRRRQFLAGLGAAGLVHAVDLARPLAAAPPKKPFPELEASGSPGTLGLAHGRTFAAAIKRNLGFYLNWLGKHTRRDTADLLRAAAKFVPVLEKHQPALLEEMRGIARGAGRRLEEILAINARTDLLVVGKQARVQTKSAAVQPGCTALALTGKGRRGQLLALGQNWDWRSELARGTVLLRLRPAGGPPLVTFTEAGMVGKIGFNAHRLGVCLNFLAHASDDPDGPPGVPVHVLLRAVMGCRSLEDAYKMVAWSPRCASANFLVAQHRRGSSLSALDLELTPNAVGRIGLSGDHLVHTNHYVNSSLEPGCKSEKNRSTINRYQSAGRQAKRLARLDDPAERMQRILADRHGAPYSISKTVAPDSSSETLAGIVMDLTRNRLHVCQGPPHEGRFVRRPGV